MLQLPNPILSTALARPTHVVLRAGTRALTAQALLTEVRRRAAFWARQGIGPGDTVALWGAPCASFVVDLHALGWLGAAAAPAALRAAGAERLQHIEATGATSVVLGPGADEALRAGFAAALGTRGCVHDSPGDAALNLAATVNFGAATETDIDVAERFWPADEVRLVVLSSGTTGVPHAVRLTAAQLLLSAVGSATRLGHHTDDAWLLCLPLHHVGGLSIVFRAAYFGASVTLMPGFDAAGVAAHLRDGTTSLVSLVPQMLSRVLDVVDAAADGGKLHTRLRAILLGGAPASRALLERCRARGLPVCVSWGMSESASQVATTWPGAYGGGGDCGPPLPFARVAPCGKEPGRLVVSGPVVGAAPLYTNDWGRVSAEGRVIVEGRCDDIIISGGENIAPFEVESVLLAHPGVADAAVVGVMDSRWGQRPVAVLVARSTGLRPEDGELAAWCRRRLSPFKIPAQFVWRNSLPRDALGKLRRRQVLGDVHQGVEHV